MSEVKHTPGPWGWVINRHAIGIFSGDCVVAEINAGDDDKYAIGDANLIAAAPELLVEGEELIAAIEVARATGFQSPVDVQNVLDAAICFSAAIAKAKGAA